MTIEMEYAEYLEDYKNLREIFLNIAKIRITENNLNALKIYYKNVINSSRVYDYIKNIEELLRILEIRNALSHENVEAFKYIEKNFLKDSNLEKIILEYERKNFGRRNLPPCNFYDLPCGKYEYEETTRILSTNRCGNDEHFFENLNENSTPEENLIENENFVKNFFERLNENSTTEENLIENENFVKNFFDNEETERRNFERISIVKVRKKICSHFGLWAAATFCTIGSLILLITITNLLSVQSVVSTEYNRTQNSTGDQNRFEESQQNGDVHATMTLFTTQPAFQLTLPGSIRFGPTTQKSNEEEESERMRMVLLKISEELGKHWRDVARFLKVKEYEIDELDSQNLPLKEKSFKALQIFQRKCDPLQWKTKLRRALDMARRRDLMELVD